MSCVFCTDPARSGDVVFENEHAWIVLHEDWSPPGHAMVVSKQHVQNASALEESDWLALARIWQQAERILLEATGAERAVVLKLGILTPHLHLHIYPVSSTATREDVFAAFDGKMRGEREEGFVEGLRRRLGESLVLRPSP